MKVSQQMKSMTQIMQRMKHIHYMDLIPDMTRSEVYLLSAIVANEGHTTKVSDLCGFAEMHPTAISRLMNTLEEKAYIERSSKKGNRRVTEVIATEKGKECNERNQRILHDYWETVFQKIPGEDIENMFRVLSEIVDSMETTRLKKLAER